MQGSYIQRIIPDDVKLPKYGDDKVVVAVSYFNIFTMKIVYVYSQYHHSDDGIVSIEVPAFETYQVTLSNWPSGEYFNRNKLLLVESNIDECTGKYIIKLDMSTVNF